MKKLLSLLLSLFSIFTALAQDDRIVSIGFVVDQDVFLELFKLPNKDQNYTMGMSFFAANNKWSRSRIIAPARYMAGRFNNLSDGRENAIVQVGLTGFTPRYLGDNIADSTWYMKSDRPFSSLLFLSTKHQIIRPRKVITNQVVVGFLGTHIGNAVQTHIHENHWFGSTREIPDGWNYQISNNGEPTFLFSNKADHLFTIFPFRSNSILPPLAQLVLSREYRVGYYTGASGGAALKLGWINPSAWATYDAYQMSNFNNLQPDERLKSEVYLQPSLKTNIVLYNAMLMGQVKENFHELNFQEMKKVVVEGFLGLGGTVAFCNGSKAINGIVYITGRTPEFDLAFKRSHYWMGLQLSFTYL